MPLAALCFCTGVGTEGCKKSEMTFILLHYSSMLYHA